MLRQLKTGLDITATVGMIIASAVVTTAWFNRSRPSTAVGLEASLPEQPISIEGTTVLGDRANAQVAIVSYSDFQCPFCGRFATQTFPRLQEKYITTGKVVFAFKHLPLEELHPLARRAAELATCADAQGQFWPLHDYIFGHQQVLTESAILGWTKERGLKQSELENCARGKGAERVAKDLTEAANLDVSSTPTFLIGKLTPAGSVQVTARLDGAVPLSRFAAAVDKSLNEAAKAR